MRARPQDALSPLRTDSFHEAAGDMLTLSALGRKSLQGGKERRGGQAITIRHSHIGALVALRPQASRLSSAGMRAAPFVHPLLHPPTA